MKISEVEIIAVKPKMGVVGFASFVIDDNVYCGLVAIHNRPRGGYRLVYPTKIADGFNREVFHPITHEAGRLIEEAVISKYEALIAE
ncbi:MAG: septation protein SpoVG family protein [Candidatus Saccharimonadales bacterium]